MPTDKKYKVQQDVLNDFVATVDANPNLTQAEIFKKFPEFNNDADLLQSATDYHATSKSGKYKTVDELNSKFPEFEFDGLKKKVGTDVSSSATPSVSVSTETAEPPKKPLLGFGGELESYKQEVPSVPQQTPTTKVKATEKTASLPEQQKKGLTLQGNTPNPDAEKLKTQQDLGLIKEDVKKMASAGIFNTTDLLNYNAKAGAYDMYLDDNQKQELKFTTNIQDLEHNLALDPNNVELRQALNIANDSYDLYVNNKNAAIDREIAELYDKDYDIADNLKKIETLKAQKENFFKDKVEQAYTTNKPEIDKLKIEGKTPKEQMVNYYLVLQKQAKDLHDQLYPNGAIDAARMAMPFGMNDWEENTKAKLTKIESTLGQLSPVVLINRSPLKTNDGFWSTAAKNFMTTTVPNMTGIESTQKQDADLLNAAIVQASIDPKSISKGVSENIQDKADSESGFKANSWGAIIGNSAGMIPSFAGSGALMSVIAKGPALAKYADLLSRTKWGRFSAGAMEEGLAYEGAKLFVADDSAVNSEANFMSGVMGYGVGAVALKAIGAKAIATRFNKTFGENAPAAARVVSTIGKRAASGVAEVGNEYGNSFGQLLDLYTSGGTWKDVKDSFNEQFGTMDKNLEFFVKTFTMGAAMGGGTALGRQAIAKAKDQYEALSPDEKEQADAFKDAMAEDIKNAKVEVVKEEVANGAEAPKVEPITPEQKAEVAAAKEVLTNESSTPEEKVAAADVVQKVEEQAQTNEVAEAIAKAEGLREVVPEEANTETTVTKEVAPIAESEANKPTFANVPILTHTAEEIETAKNEVFDNLNKLEVGSVIENSDGEIKVVTEKSTDKKGNQLIGIVTYERQSDGSLRQMTNIVWASKSAEGKIKLDYNPHSTGTNLKGERVTVTDQITDKKIDLSKENIFTEDENGNLIQINKVEPSLKETTEASKNAPTLESDNNNSIPIVEQRDLKNGDKISATIYGKKVNGIVTGVGEHKGQIVIDIKQDNGDERFIYGNQIDNIEKGAIQLPASDNFTKDERDRFNKLQGKLIAGEDMSGAEMADHKKLYNIKNNITNEQPTQNETPTSNVGESVQKPNVAPAKKSAKFEVKFNETTVDQKAIDFLEKLKIDTKNTLGAFGLIPAALNTILDGMIVAIKGGVAIKTAIDEAIVKAKAISKDFDEKGFTAKMNEIFGSKIEKEAVKTESKTEEKAEPKEAPKAKEEPKKEKEESERPKRKTTQQFIEMYPELEGSLEDDTIYYDRLPNKVTLEEAKGIIDYLGEEEAMKAFADASNGMSWATRNTVGQLLIKKLNADGQYDKAIEVLEKLVESATELGQGIQALSMFKFLTPEGQLRAAERTRQKQNKKIVNKAQGKIDKTEKALSDINASAVDEVVKAIETKVEAVDKIVPEQKPRTKKYGESNKVVTNQRYQALKKALKGKLFSNIPPELFEIAAYHLEATGRKFADFSTEMIKDFGKKVKPYLKTLYDDAKAKLSDKYSDFESESDVNSQFDEMVSNVAFDETKKGEPKPPSVKSIIKKHYTTPSSKSLKNKLMDDAGLSEKEAQDISDAAQRAFQKLTYDRKMKVIQKAFGKSANAQKLADNLIHLSSIGALSNPQIANNYAQTMGIPSITPQQVQQITTLTNQVAAATPGFRQNRAIQQLMSYQANMKGFSKWDVAMGIWYANILSGHKTQMVNAVSNMTNALANFTVSVLRNPKKGKLLAQAYLEGAYKGYFEAMDALRTGYSPIRDKVNVPSVLERVTFKGGKFNPFNYHKYVSRIMTAVDTVFFEGAKNMREYQWADMLASNSNMPVNSTYKKRAAEYMNNNDAEITQIKAQAEQEYQDAIANGTPKKEAVRDRRRRVFELIEAARGEDIRTEGQSYGQRTTFTNPPEGLLGWAAKGLSKAGEQFKPLKLVVPFTNVIANVANTAIDYTPWGLARAGTGGSVSSLVSEKMRRKDWETMTPLQRKVAREEMLIKGMIGTASAAALFMLSQKWDDDDEPVLEITANGTGDYRKNYQLQENGWQPYSIKYKGKWYSYQNSPLLVILAFVGNIRDFEAYRNEKPTDEGAITKMALAANNTKTVFFDMTFLKGLNTFLQAVVTNKSSNPLEDAQKGVVNTAKGFVLPNLYTQMAKEIQAIYDIPQKEVGSSILGQFVRDIPAARNKYNDKINSLGDPIVADTDKFVSNVKDAPEFDLMTSHKYFLNVPSKKESFLPDADGVPRLMTEDEYYNFVKIRGAYIKQSLKDNFEEYSQLSNSEFADVMGSLSRSATSTAKNEISPEQ